MGLRLKKCFVFGVLLFMLNISYADTLDTELSRNQMALGETVTLSFTLNTNSSRITPDFSVLENDFRILGTNYGNTMNLINGSFTTQTFWRLTLEPKKAGTISIPEINFGNIHSEAKQLTVIANPSYVKNEQTSASVFIQAEINNNRPYIQSQVYYKFKLFYQTQIDNPRLELPQMQGATFFDLGGDKNYLTTVNGRPYHVVEKIFAFFPQKSGDLLIPSTRFTAMTYDIQSNLNNPFEIATPRSVSLTTKAFNLTVRPTPRQFKGQTWLPANHISITEDWSEKRDYWEAGNPVTRTISIIAQGLRADQIPDVTVDKIPGVNVYLDPPKRNNDIQNNSVVGTLEQKVTYIPNSTQNLSIPPIKLYWWNLQTNTNELAQLNGFTVAVKGKILPTKVSPSLPLPTTNINHPAHAVKPEANDQMSPFYQSIWFWIASGSFLTWVITLYFIWSKRKVTKPFKPEIKPVHQALTEDDFIQACHHGNAMLARQFLLAWARKHSYVQTYSLVQLSSNITDESVKTALKNLERALYSKKDEAWDGQALLLAYQWLKKHLKTQPNLKKTKDKDVDPLPELNPSNQ